MELDSYLPGDCIAHARVGSSHMLDTSNFSPVFNKTRSGMGGPKHPLFSYVRHTHVRHTRGRMSLCELCHSQMDGMGKVFVPQLSANKKKTSCLEQKGGKKNAGQKCRRLRQFAQSRLGIRATGGGRALKNLSYLSIFRFRPLYIDNYHYGAHRAPR